LNKTRRNQHAASRIFADAMKLKLLTIALLALAAPAFADEAHPDAGAPVQVDATPAARPDFRQRRVLAMAAFAAPAPPRRTLIIKMRTLRKGAAVAHLAPIEPKAEWFSDEGLHITPRRVAYTARF
jgi:hypothetical protein